MDNHGTHRTDHLKRWLERHRRFKIHFISTSSSWMDYPAANNMCWPTSARFELDRP
jgi:hypothetical protein